MCARFIHIPIAIHTNIRQRVVLEKIVRLIGKKLANSLSLSIDLNERCECLCLVLGTSRASHFRCSRLFLLLASKPNTYQNSGPLFARPANQTSAEQKGLGQRTHTHTHSLTGSKKWAFS